MLLDRLCAFFRGSGRFCARILLYLNHHHGTILDPLGILACLLLIPSLVFIHWLSAMRLHRCYEI